MRTPQEISKDIRDIELDGASIDVQNTISKKQRIADLSAELYTSVMGIECHDWVLDAVRRAAYLARADATKYEAMVTKLVPRPGSPTGN